MTTSRALSETYGRKAALKPEEMVEIYAPKSVIRSFAGVSRPGQALELARNGSVVSLSTLARHNGSDKVVTILKMHLVELNDILGLKNSMTRAQVEAMAFEIFQLYSHMNIADINNVMGRIKRGECGKLYDRLTMPQLMQAFAEYHDERCDEAARISREEAESYKGIGLSMRHSEMEKEKWREAGLLEFTRKFKQSQ